MCSNVYDVYDMTLCCMYTSSCLQNSSEQTTALSKYERIWATYQAKYESKEKVRLLRSKEEQLHTFREHSTPWPGLVMLTVHIMYTVAIMYCFRCSAWKADPRTGTDNSCHETESRWESSKLREHMFNTYILCIYTILYNYTGRNSSLVSWVLQM